MICLSICRLKIIYMDEDNHDFLPKYLVPSHNLYFLNHDILVKLLCAWEEAGISLQKFTFYDDNDRQEFNCANDVFDWLENTGRESERSEFLKKVVFPALLSDFLHFIYEALVNSRKAKLNVTYALLRKPIQENLFLLEIIATDPDLFSSYLIENPLMLRAEKAGGLEVHTKRILNVLRVIQEEHTPFPV